MAKILAMGIMTILLMGFFLIAPQVNADIDDTIVTNVVRNPIFPIYGEAVNISATITDVDGINISQISYCDDMLCYPPIDMVQLGTTDVYYGEIPFKFGQWGNGTPVGYEFRVKDLAGNWVLTEKEYYFFVSAINLSTEISRDNLKIGESVIVNGSAFYNDNTTARVAGVNVTFRISGSTIDEYYHYMTSDANGNFSIEIPFNVGGGFEINVTMTDRTLVAYAEYSVWVLDILQLSENLQMTTCYPDTYIWVNGTAKYNNGDPVVNSDVEVKINETLTWSGKTDSTGNYSIFISAPSDLGNYYVNVSVINGTLDQVNSTSLTVCAVPQPDLAVSSDEVNVTSNYNPFIEGEEIEIKVIIRNLGTEDVSNIPIKIFKGHPSLENMIVENNNLQINAGSYATYTLSWFPLNGTFDVWIVIDLEDIIDESYEDNNNCTVQIFVDNDFDADKLGDTIDPDDDGDGFDDVNDDFPFDLSEWIDTDLDGTGNNADVDDDNDGLLDGKELAIGTDPLNADTDSDGVIDGSDYDPLDPSVTTKPDEPESFPWVFMVIILVIVVATVLFMLFYGKRNKERPNP